ncbi:MAG: SEL1-like repeat protein [Alphaproteobacteria bacterium]|nr:MAG: SEL1-like repeat protein [Alphaproteobacteria bacterium]
MAQYECADAPTLNAETSAAALYDLGIMHACGRSAPVDLVTAHKWFNIAAMKGYADAARMRREIAAEMTDAEIGQAQRAARDWLKSQPEAATVAPQLRAAA